MTVAELCPESYQFSTQGASDVLSHSGLLSSLDFSDNPLSCLLFNPKTAWFVYGGVAIGYFVYNHYYICIGGLLGPKDNHDAALDRFIQHCAGQRLIPIFIHLSDTDCHRLRKKGYSINFVGQSYSIDLRYFSCAGKRYQQLRNKINRAQSAAVNVEKIDSQESYAKIVPDLDIINTAWIKFKKIKELHGLITDFSSVEMRSGAHIIYIARHNDRVVAYIVYTRTCGKYPGWYHDLSRRLPQAPDGTMQLINQQAINNFKNSDKANYLHLGFTPLVEPDSSEIFYDSIYFHKITQWLAMRGGIVYPARSQRQYKMSWRPNMILSEHVAFPENKPLQSLWGLLRATHCL